MVVCMSCVSYLTNVLPLSFFGINMKCKTAVGQVKYSTYLNKILDEDDTFFLCMYS